MFHVCSFQCSSSGLDPVVSIQFFVKRFVQTLYSIEIACCIYRQAFHCFVSGRYSTILKEIHTLAGHLSKVLVSLTIQLIYNRLLCRGLLVL